MSILAQLRDRVELRQEIEESRANKVRLDPAVAEASLASKLTRRQPSGSLLAQGSNGKSLKAVLEQAAERSDPAGYAEVRRITRLPIVYPLTPEEHEAFCEEHTLGDAYRGGWRYYDVQAAAILAFQETDGLFGPIGVGWGKTLITLKCADIAYREKGIRKSVLFVPPEVYTQLVKTDIAWARRRVHLGVPFHSMGGKPARARRQLARSRKKGCYILPYSYLSVKDTVELLEWIRPELIIADEAQCLKNRHAARTKRVMDYIAQYQPKLIALSGTITSKSIKDYYHLIKAALGRGCPLPLAAQLASEWALVVDSGSQPSKAQAGPLKPLVEWTRKNFEEDIPFDVTGFRKAFQMRLRTTPGVVATGDSEIGTTLVIANRPVKEPESAPGWGKLEGLIGDVVDAWITPNGDEIEHAIHTFKWLYELSAGFYNELVWPEVSEYAKRKDISTDEADARIKQGMAHHAAGQVYASLLRSWLNDHARPGLDTPMLVGGHMANHGAAEVGIELFSAWQDMKALETDTMAERDAHAIRVSPYKVNHVVRWAEKLPKKEGALIWVHHQEIGRWIYELLQEAGLNALHCPAGEQHNQAILDPENARKIVVASIHAHGTGKNLQAFQHTLFAQWPRSASVAEQSMGRNHRNGQEADELVMTRIDTTEFDTLCFAACLTDTVYQQQTLGNRRKLVIAGYDPLPAIYPSEFLRERGFQNRVLTGEAKALLEEKFQAEESALSSRSKYSEETRK